MISILMIVFQVEQYVARAIESVLAQDYTDFELIIVIGEDSKDRCEEICREYAAKDSRIKIVVAPPKGPADARNHGLAEVRGDYLGFVDADDYIEPDMFSSMLKNMKDTNSDIAVCGRFYEYQNKTLQDPDGKPVVYTADDALKVTLNGDGFFLHCWDKLFSKKIFEGLHFRTDIQVEDRIIVDKLLGKADRVVYDSTPKYHFRERSGSLSKKSGMVRKNVEANELMQAFLLENHPAVRSECQRFMLYEYITAVQNELVSVDTNKKDLREYQGKVRSLVKEKNELVGRNLKFKAWLSIYTPHLLGLYTSVRQKNVANDLVRFP